MGLMTQADWDAYTDSINNWQEDAFQQDVKWLKNQSSLSEHGEDDFNIIEEINIKGLVLYNYFRSWATNVDNIAGEIDKESLLLYLNKKYLNDLGYITPDGQFAFSPSLDRFIISGVKYKASGESQTAQANSETILHFIILKRDEINTGNTKH